MKIIKYKVINICKTQVFINTGHLEVIVDYEKATEENFSRILE